MTETERKFLVTDRIHEALKGLTSLSIRQGYVMDSPDGRTVRVRTKGDKGFLTIKGPSSGISRTEFEYEIPHEDALALLNDFCPLSLHKERYNPVIGGKKWDVDVFHGKLQGLIVAEIELESADEHFERPDWLGSEVSDDARYYNVNLVKGEKP